MPITATFTADFKSFYDAVQQSTVKLKDFQSNAEAVAQKVDKVANAFSGRKLVQDAEIMTKAITEIGGATALTAKEQAQVNAKLAEAIEKYRVLGQVAPQNMQDLEKATRQVNQETGKASTGIKDIGSSLLKMASAVGIAFSAQAVLGFVKSVFDSASQIQDMSEKLGISAEAVQRFSYAAEQAGGSIDDVGAALFKMNQKLAEGDKSTVHALTDLNLKLADLRNMSPEQAFTTIADAIGKIENPMVRARLEMELLGKAGGALGAAISAGFSTVTKDATAMANDTVKALADAQQAWENLGNKVIVVTGTMIAETAKAVQQITASWRGFAAFVGTTLTSGVGVAMTQASAMQTGANAAGGRGDVNLPSPAKAGAAELARLAQEREAAARKAEAAADKQKAADEKIFQGMRQFGAELEKREALLKRSEAGMQRFIELNRSAATPLDEVTRGVGVNNAALERNAAGLKIWGHIVGDEYNKAAAKAKEFFKELPPAVDEFKRLNDEMQKFAEVTGNSVVAGIARVTGGIQTMRESYAQAKDGIKEFTAGITQMISGNIIGGIATLIGSLSKLWDAAKRAWGAVKSIFGFGTGGRDAVVAFAESQGGFDALQKQLEALGEEGDRLWRKLTQGTGRNNPEEAARNIAEVEEALRRHEEASDDVTGATEEQARATIETASEAERAMKALEPLLKANEDQWRAWGDVVNGQIDRVAAALRSLALPNLSGAAVQQSTPTSGGGTAVINLDGRQIAEAVVPRIPGVVRRYGLA
jgi:hypothetical protein